MNKYTPEQYKEILYKLPQEIRDVVISYNTTQHLWKIGEKHSLQIDKIGIMHDLSMDVMMGIVPTKNFAKTLSEELDISALEGANLARDIDENIFRPIKKNMIDMYGDGAPNKPSSSLVEFYEEESEHPLLKKADILKEIESPAPVKVRVEEGEEAKMEKIVPKKKEGAVKTTALEIYPEEIEGKVLDIKEDVKAAPTKSEDLKASAQQNSLSSKLSPGFAKLVDMKLSQAVVMPKREEGEEKKMEKIEIEDQNSLESRKVDLYNPFVEEQKIHPAPKPITPETAQTPTPKAQAPAAPTPISQTPVAKISDPYREPLN